ncbi:hypothetical protein LTR09_007363 [Extremus antarcticus]|uniref:Uncharacterized protein n=1 Tax=Extremus antarcticus TaxID=702011 RepID=A0AAJ0G7P4_9PEZI|nr:hypothetical protein LTR09_007363 [Extremus antarcticus]
MFRTAGKERDEHDTKKVFPTYAKAYPDVTFEQLELVLPLAYAKAHPDVTFEQLEHVLRNEEMSTHLIARYSPPSRVVPRSLPSTAEENLVLPTESSVTTPKPASKRSRSFRDFADRLTFRSDDKSKSQAPSTPSKFNWANEVTTPIDESKKPDLPKLDSEDPKSESQPKTDDARCGSVVLATRSLLSTTCGSRQPALFSQAIQRPQPAPRAPPGLIDHGLSQTLQDPGARSSATTRQPTYPTSSASHSRELQSAAESRAICKTWVTSVSGSSSKTLDEADNILDPEGMGDQYKRVNQQLPDCARPHRRCAQLRAQEEELAEPDGHLQAQGVEVAAELDGYLQAREEGGWT